MAEGIELLPLLDEGLPKLSITYKGSPKSKYMRSMWVFNKVAAASEKYNTPVYVKVEKGESLHVLIIVGVAIATIGGGAFVGELAKNLADDIYKYVKRKFEEEENGSKKFKSKMLKPEINKAWEELSRKGDEPRIHS